MSHGRGDLSYPVFWGNHVLLQHGHIAWLCLFPCLATTLGTPLEIYQRKQEKQDPIIDLNHMSNESTDYD
ncbi:hypothetical protein GOBAR_AA22407 [Gossypium barbadense]|uniref:Uncharacterized protein n=1 Tax=Gossypium barbadense TaxID=3634 RepID=A0A2P5X4P7_GOSBA|nr:hypothetical protein GOBAR_AA22407 [Gossypium barbadense]